MKIGKTAKRQSFNYNKRRKLGYLGLEPRTNRLKAEYSTIELATLVRFYHEIKKILKYLF